MPSLRHLVCESQITPPLLPNQLAAIWHALASSPARQNVTGLLIYLPDGHYLHVLEGQEGALDTLIEEKLLGQLQPSDCSIVGQGPWAARSFPGLSISFVSEQLTQDLPGFVPLQELVMLVPRLAPNRPTLVYRIMEFIAPYVEARLPAAMEE